MKTIGEKIYDLRKQKGVSQEKLADGIAVARYSVSRWETNAAQPTTENIKALCKFFGVASAYFLDSCDEDVQPEPEAQTVTTPRRFGTLKTVSIVAGIVLLILFVAACGIAAYVAVSPGMGGEWSEDIHIVNYEGIIFLVLGTVAVAVLITLTVLLIIKTLKSRKK